MSSNPPTQSTSWFRVRIALQCIRKINTRIEHPCHIFHGILIAAVKNSRDQLASVWCWHPADSDPWPDMVEKGRIYRIDVIFAGVVAADSFFLRLNSQKIVNFSLESASVPEIRTPALLEKETPAPDWASDEICLDFGTPLSWEARSPNAPRGPDRWHLDTRRLVRMLHHRLAIFLGFPEPPPETPLPEILVRSSFAKSFGGHAHASKSSSGQVAFSGLRGPIYIRGDWQSLWLPLIICSELQLGSNTPRGQGSYTISSARPLLDPTLQSTYFWQAARRTFRQREHAKDQDPNPALPEEAELPPLISGLLQGTLDLAPARITFLPKKDGANDARRPIAILPIREQYIHSVLQRLLQPILESTFLPQSIGARNGLSREDARPIIDDALRDHCTHVVQADVEAFFDHIDWQILGRQLREILPRADTATLALLERCIRQPLADIHGEPLLRRGGLLQGSPLSPLLANLYLHEWDIAIASRGRSFVRFMDDIRILTHSADEADAALSDATELMDSLRLRFNSSKMAIHDLQATHSFRFLGLTFGQGEPASRESGAPLKRNLYLTRRETWAGVENNALVLRKGNALEERVPLHRVGEIILLGAGGISTELIDRCLRQGIPISFCNHRGQHHGSLHHDRRTILARIARHHRRHENLGLNGRAKLAAALVQAKLANYLSWLSEFPASETGTLRRQIHTSHDAAGAAASGKDSAAAIDIIRGHEGAAARAIFPWINRRMVNPDWISRTRVPHERPDRGNLLQDTLSFLLFGRIHTSICSRGLDPWLGFLHSPENHYPSLIYDLMEPFRARLHRFSIWLVREGAISTSLTLLDQDGCYGFTHDGWVALIRQFERHLDVDFAGDDGRTLRQLIQRQVEDLARWVEEGVDLRLYSRPVPAWKKPLR